MENALPGVRLEWKLAKGGRPVALPQRDAWIAEAAMQGNFWGHATPDSAAMDIEEQTSRPFHGPHVPPRGLPVLKKSEDIRSPEIPHRLGWLNYWSAAAAQSIGFPDPQRDADLLSRSRRTATGGWVVRLTQEPLDLDNHSHLDVLLRTYERFVEAAGIEAV
jgi:hypothetical protein